MERGVTGRYEITVVGGERVEAFIPAPLPPDPPLEMDASRRKLLERATLALGRLDSITLLLPDPHLFLYGYVRREAVLSSQIEGTQSSLSDLLMFEISEMPGVPLDDVEEVSNYVAALNHGLRRLKEGFPLCNRLVREMHAVLLSGGRGSTRAPGEFRRSQNWIGGSRPGVAAFVPPPPQYVEGCMSELERFIHDETGLYPAVLKAALVHVQFETIHPFLDGNGRMGRLLIPFVLHHEKVLSQPLLYLSLYFKEHRDEYYGLLDEVRTRGDWEAWVDFFLRGVELTATDAVETARRLVTVFEEDENLIRAKAGRSASSVIRAFRVLGRYPLACVKRVCEGSGLSFPSASRAMKVLERLGIVREITGRRRNRIYAYGRYLDILAKGT